MPEGLQRLWRTFFDIDQIRAALPEIVIVGVPNTILLSIVATLIGLALGLVVAMLLISRSWLVRSPARMYVDVFRGLPVILTIYLVGQGLPIAGLKIFGNNSYAYAALALGLIEGAGADGSVYPYHQRVFARLPAWPAAQPARDLQHCLRCVLHLRDACADGRRGHRVFVPDDPAHLRGQPLRPASQGRTALP